jgi:hypothetical protein
MREGALMSKKKETLCDWKKGTYLDDLEMFRRIVTNFKHACAKCGRVAKEKKMLCKPVRIAD